MEVSFASAIFSSLLLGSAALLHVSTVQFQDTVYSSYADTDTSISVNKIRTALAQACSVTFEAGGMGIQYKCFATNADGTFMTDPTTGKGIPDNTVHTLEFRKPTATSTRYCLYWDQAEGGLQGTPVVREVSLSDPNPETSGAVTYQPFSLEGGVSNIVRLKMIMSPQYGTPGAGVRSATQRIVTDITCRNIL